MEAKYFIAAFIEMEKALRNLPLNIIWEAQQIQRNASVSDMLRELRYKDWLEQQKIDDMYHLNRLRNTVVHGENISNIENSDYEKVKECTDKLKELRNTL